MYVSVIRFSLINGLCDVRSVQNCANAARTHHTFPLQPSTSLAQIMKDAGAVSLPHLSKASPNKRACTCSRSFYLLSLRVALENSDFST